MAPKNYSFFDLHCAIQGAVGWTDSHLHGFYIGEHKGRNRISIEFPNPDNEPLYRKETRDERKEYIADYFGKTIKQCIYAYDFGDGWDHTVVFERLVPRDSKTQYPKCIAGENACPPEDCGGVGGYDELQGILKNPSNPEHSTMLEWLGINDPNEFDVHEFDPQEVEFENPKKRLIEYDQGFGV